MSTDHFRILIKEPWKNENYKDPFIFKTEENEKHSFYKDQLSQNANQKQTHSWNIAKKILQIR